MALLADGTGLSWGEGQSGQLGDGSTANRATTRARSPLGGASELSGDQLTAALRSSAPRRSSTWPSPERAAAGSAASGIVCPPSCSDRDPQGQTEALRALPDPGSGFAGFSGPCAGTGPCFAKLSQDQTVTATFGPPKGTAITKATIKNPKKKAVFSFSAPGAITGYQCELIRPKPKRKGKRHRRRDARRQGVEAAVLGLRRAQAL